MVQTELQIPAEFLKEEVRSEYTVSALMKEVWAVQLDLVYQVQKICKKHNIEYFADGGTLLGLARHQGFIPWDDDIDLAMTRENYTRFLEVAKKELKEPYFLQIEDTIPWTVAGGYAQICNSNTTMIHKATLNRNFKYNQGIRIDIFPLDKVPDDLTEQNDFFLCLQAMEKRYQRFRNRLHNDRGEHNYIKSALFIFARILHIKNWAYSAFEKECQKYNATLSKYMGSISYIPKRSIGLCEVDLYKDLIDLPFEFITLPAPRKYEQYLTDFYGDWKIPKQGASLHEGETVFDTCVSYKKYLKKFNNGD
jgi:lipopolysaccharide cholinephosphotransferase